MIPVAELRTAAEVIANVKAVRARLGMGPISRPVVLPDVIRAAERRDRREKERLAEEEVLAKKRERHARFLEDAHRLRQQLLAWAELRMFCALMARGVRDGLYGSPEPSEFAIQRVEFVPAAEILKWVQRVTGFNRYEIAQYRRTAEILAARHLLIWALTAFSKHSLPAIGQFVGGRDHSTVLHAKRKVDAIRLAAGIEIDRDQWHSVIVFVYNAMRKTRCGGAPKRPAANNVALSEGLG